MHAAMRKTSANHKGTLFTTHLNVSEIPGKVAVVPIRRKRNEQRSPDSDCSTRGIPMSLRLSCSSCQLKVILLFRWALLKHYDNMAASSCEFTAKWNGIM